MASDPRNYDSVKRGIYFTLKVAVVLVGLFAAHCNSDESQPELHIFYHLFAPLGKESRTSLVVSSN
jgi:hypothetical protein